MKLCVSKKYSLLYLLLAVLIYETIAKYIGVSWSSTVYSNVVTMQGKTIPTLKYIELALILLLCFSRHTFKRNIVVWSGCTMLALGIIWSVYNADYGLALVYLNTPPVLLIEIGCLYLIFQDPDIREKLISLCGFLAVFFTVVTLIDLLSFLRQYSLIRMANGNIIEHYANALFLLAVWNCFTDRRRKKIYLIYGCSICLLLMSIFITSRGWMFQAVILVASVYYSKSNRNLFSKLRRIVLLICIFIVVYSVIMHYMNDAFMYIMNRMGQDTRSSQLLTFFEQGSILKLLIGQGLNATYVLNGVDYAFVDNIFLFWMFRYGVLSVLAYWLPFVYGLFLKTRNPELRHSFPYNVMILMWIMAMGGLCIYYSIRLDVANIYLLMGTVEYIESKKKNSNAYDDA